MSNGKLLSATKAEVGPISGFVESKKYGLAGMFAGTCLVVAILTMHWAPWIAGSIAVASYCIAQGNVDSAGARNGGAGEDGKKP